MQKMCSNILNYPYRYLWFGFDAEYAKQHRLQLGLWKMMPAPGMESMELQSYTGGGQIGLQNGGRLKFEIPPFFCARLKKREKSVFCCLRKISDRDIFAPLTKLALFARGPILVPSKAKLLVWMHFGLVRMLYPRREDWFRSPGNKERRTTCIVSHSLIVRGDPFGSLPTGLQVIPRT